MLNLEVNLSSGFQEAVKSYKALLVEFSENWCSLARKLMFSMLLAAVSVTFWMHYPSVLPDFFMVQTATCPGKILAHAWSVTVVSPLRFISSSWAPACRSWGEGPAPRQLRVMIVSWAVMFYFSWYWVRQ